MPARSGICAIYGCVPIGVPVNQTIITRLRIESGDCDYAAAVYRVRCASGFCSSRSRSSMSIESGEKAVRRGAG